MKPLIAFDFVPPQQQCRNRMKLDDNEKARSALLPGRPQESPTLGDTVADAEVFTFIAISGHNHTYQRIRRGHGHLQTNLTFRRFPTGPCSRPEPAIQ
eukprot:gene23443-biopygen8633